jgi:hypothetical protein
MAEQDFLAKIRLSLEGKEEVVSGLQQTQQAAQKMGTTQVAVPFAKEGLATGADLQKAVKGIGEETKKSSRQMSDFELALRRALIVAPVWMAARAAIQQVTSFLQDGIKYYLDTEDAIHNIGASLQEMGTTGTSTIDVLIERFKTLSITSGKSVASLGNSFAELNRILGDSEKSYLALESATKLSIATGVDNKKLTETIAFLYKLQGDSLKGLTTDAQKFEAISELLYATQAKTPGGIEKLSADIRSFAATMSIADFGIENTIKLFGALEASGISSSQVLRTGVMKVLSNIDEISKALNITIPKNTAPFDAFIMVLDKLRAALQPGKINTDTLAAIKDIFGTGARGASQVAALAKDLETLKQSLSMGGVSTRERYLYQKQIEDVTSGAGHQIEVFKNLKAQLGETFITGVMGGKDFADAMNNINKAAQNPYFQMWLQGLGQIGKTAYNLTAVGFIADKINEKQTKQNQLVKNQADLFERVRLNYRGQLTLAERNALYGEIASSKLIADSSLRKKLLADIIKQNLEELKSTQIKKKNNDLLGESEILTKKQVAFREKLKQEELDNKYQLMKIAGVKEEEIAYVKVVDKVAELNRIHTEEPLVKMTDVLAKNFGKIRAVSPTRIEDEKKFNDLIKARYDLEVSVAQAIVNANEKRISMIGTIGSLLGTENSKVIQQQMALRYLLQGENYLKNSMEDRLKLAEALTQEADKQEQKSAHLVELYKIAQRYGVAVAREVSQFVGGTKQISQLTPEAIRALQRFNPAALEEAKAQAFFKPVGFQFPEEIEAARRTARNRQILNQVTVAPINLNLNVNIDTESILDKIKVSIDKALDEKESTLTKKINDAIELF